MPDSEENKQADASIRLFSNVLDAARAREIIRKQSVKAYLHMYYGNVQQYPLCAASFFAKGGSYGNKILYKNLKFFDKIFVRKSCRRRFRNAPYGEKILLMGKSYVWA